MADEKVLSPEEEKVIAKISGTDSLEDTGDGLGHPTEEELLGQPEDLHIDNASGVVTFTKEQVLEADMKKLTRLDIEIEKEKESIARINGKIFDWAQKEGLATKQASAEKKKKELTADYKRLKDDIAARGLALSKAGEYEDRLPAPGVQIKLYSREDLDVDIEKAVAWAVENGHVSLLTIIGAKYLDLLKTGVFKDQPGKIDETPEYKASISLKPYQKKEG